MSDEITVARAALHKWEEPCISGTVGSGAVFFTGCNMGCVYCQNYQISRGRKSECLPGEKLTIQELADTFLRLEQEGAVNINLVTPTHYMPQIAYSLLLAKEQGLSLPIVYNSSGYECVESLKQLEGLVDVYLPDLKYRKGERASRYSHAPDYPSAAEAAIAEMYRQVGTLQFGTDGLLKKGMIVRHLVLPDTNRDTKQILRSLKEQYGDRIMVSLMRQYTPIREQLAEFPELWEEIPDEQYERCVRFAQDIGMTNVYIQEKGTAKESFIPDFK